MKRGTFPTEAEGRKQEAEGGRQKAESGRLDKVAGRKSKPNQPSRIFLGSANRASYRSPLSTFDLRPATFDLRPAT
ncbi:MAG TPA: hypothetical protein VGL91_11195 [Acidobacteriota bacterium]